MTPRNVLVCAILCLLSVPYVHAQQYAFEVYFADKAGAAPLSDSASFLSSRAFTRRASQGIAVDSVDRPVSPAYIDSVIAFTSGKIHLKSKWLNMCVVLVTDSTHIHDLEGKPYVTDVRRVGIFTPYLKDGTRKTRTIRGAKMTDDAAYYGYTYPQTNMVHGNYLHDLGYKGQGMLIAVLDAGFVWVDWFGAFDSLRASGRILDEHNFTLDTGYVFSYDIHGTEVLSTMAAYVPDTFVGTAPLASYALYVTEDTYSEQRIELDNMVAGMERADSIGADIISTSLGYNTFDDGNDLVFATDCDGKTTVAARGANIATQKGMLVVPSAGNEGGDSWNFVLTPGDADSALTVGSVDGSGNPASTSGYGPNAAGRVKPDVCDLGEFADVVSYSNTYVEDGGTSFSTPQIAGWAACLWQSSGAATTPYMLRAAIDSSANHHADPTTHIGFGIPNFETAKLLLSVDNIPGPATTTAITAYPNPFTSAIHLYLSLAAKTTVTFRLLDLTGRTVTSDQQTFEAGKSIHYTLAVPAGLPIGVYVLEASAPGLLKIAKVIKQ